MASPSIHNKGLIIIAPTVQWARDWCDENSINWRQENVIIPTKELDVLGKSVAHWRVVRLGDKLPISTGMAFTHVMLRGFAIEYV
jgi:hypothetical protein